MLIQSYLIAGFLKEDLSTFLVGAALTGTGSFHCSANFPVMMFLNIFINEVIRVQHGDAGGRKLEFFQTALKFL